eukprot:SAG31_NODE_1707_length_7484_cov_8.798104_10_plen_187_part_00
MQTVPSPPPSWQPSPTHRSERDLLNVQNGAVRLVTVVRNNATQDAAAAASDFGRAGQLRDLIAAIAPNSGGPMSLEQCAPRTLEGQLRFFRTNGFVVVRDALCGPALSSVQQAWDAVAPRCKEEWERQASKGRGVNRHTFAKGTTVARKQFGVPLDIRSMAALMSMPDVVPFVQRLVGDPETNVCE